MKNSSSLYLEILEMLLDVDEKMYHGIVESLLYLIASRADIMYSVRKCARFQYAPKESYLTTIMRIIGYLIGNTKLGLWYPRFSHLYFIGYSDADFTGDQNDGQTLGKSLISWHKKNHLLDSTIKSEYLVVESCGTQLL